MSSRLAFAAAVGIALAAASSPAAAQGSEKKRQVVDRVVAVVNDSVILQSELMMRVAPLAADIQKVSDPRERKRRREKLKSKVLDEMVDEELIHQAAEESKLEVSAKEVQSAIEEIKQQNDLDDNQLSEALRLQGYTMSSYRKDVRKQILRMRAVNMLVRPRVTVTEDDIRARYKEMNRRSAAVSRVHLHHILIALPEKPTNEQLEAGKDKAARLIQNARSGAEFAELAREHSDDLATKNSGGDLGWIERGSIATEWETIVFAMDEGETRGPITGPKGLHVFHVSEVERSEKKPFEEMKEQIRNELYRREMDRQTELWLEEQRKKAHIEVKL